MASAGMLLLLYGYGSGAFGWFPGRFLDDAVEQAAAYFGPPRFLGPRIYERDGARIENRSRIEPGFTLIASHFKEWDWRTGLRLIDEDGNPVHQWQADPQRLFERIGSTRGTRATERSVHGSYLFPNGDVLVTVDYVGIARLDACSNVLWQLTNRAHHSIARAEDGTFWVPVTTAATKATSDRYPDGYPGLQQPINHDKLLHLTEDGEELETISVLDVLYRNGLFRYLRKTAPEYPGDLLHVNDVEPLSRVMSDQYPLFDAGDLVVSIKAPSLVMVIDPKTEDVKWHTADPFIQQHDPDFLGDGWIGVFDNNRDGTSRGTLLGGSRIIALQPHTDSARVLFPTAIAEPFYTSFLGKWQQLDNGNLLLTEGRAGRVVEVGPDGSTVWEWVHQAHEESRAVEVTEGTRYDLDSAQVRSWPCGLAE